MVMGLLRLELKHPGFKGQVVSGILHSHDQEFDLPGRWHIVLQTEQMKSSPRQSAKAGGAASIIDAGKYSRSPGVRRVAGGSARKWGRRS